MGSQKRAQRSQICGNKQDLINLLIAGLNHTPFLKSTPHPAPLFLRFLRELRGKCAPLFHFQLLQPVASMGKLASGLQPIAVHRGSPIWDLRASRLRRRRGQGREGKGQKQPHSSSRFLLPALHPAASAAARRKIPSPTF